MRQSEIDRFLGRRLGKSTAMLRYAVEMAESGKRVAIVSKNKSVMADRVEEFMGHNVFPEGLHVVGIDDKQPQNTKKRLTSK